MRTKLEVIMLLMVAGVLAWGAVSCAGKGVTYAEVEKTIGESCRPCHDAKRFETDILDKVKALDDALFGAGNFPDANFPGSLRALDTAALITAADPPEDAQIAPATPLRKAWLLHELNELLTLLREAVPPDYTSEAAFNAFVSLGNQGSFEGCEMGDKLDKGLASHAEGMPPQWAKKLLQLLNVEFQALDPVNREMVKNYVDGQLPGGLGACTPGQGS